ncbi:MAG: flippase-like domain-containing protein [Magnetococcales bacterium]|nr:flippase-like domain-containing protein [Magnetococcales bacterium]
MNKPYLRWILLVLKFAIAATVMIWMFKGGKLDWSMVLEGALSFDVIGVGILCNLALVSSAGVRWHWLLKGQGVDFPFKFAHHLTYVTAFFNQLIPGGIGGDALRLAFVLKQSHARKGQAALTIILDRFLGLFSMLLIAALGSLLMFDYILASPPLMMLVFSTLLLVVGGPPGALLLLWLLRRTDRFPAWIKGHPGGRWHRLLQLGSEFANCFNSGKKHVFMALGISLFGQSLEVMSLVWIAYHLSMLIIPVKTFFLAGPWAWIANILPISPGGLGVGEAAFDQLCQWLSPVTVSAAFGTIFLVNRLFMILATIPGLLFFLFRKHFLPHAPEVPSIDSLT